MKRLLILSILCLLSTQSWSEECISGNCVNGYGTYTWANGEKYVGEFKDGKGNGYGTSTWANGAQYVGEWRDGKQHGQATYTYANGAQYVGEWRNNKQHGQGTYTWADGRKQAGIWGNGEYLGTIAEAKRKKQAEAEAKRKYDKIYNACLLDKSDGVDMSVRSLERAVKTTCEEIAKDPSWLESLKYN